MILRGILPAVTTPFRQDEELDLDHLQSNLQSLNRRPLAGYVIGGSNGEFVHLSNEERLQVVSVARQSIPSERLLVVGAGMESTRMTIEMTKCVAAEGADAAILVTPSYYMSKMTAEALEAHYLRVADVSPIPIVLYNVPANTGINLPVEAVIHLAPHPNIIGLKDSGGEVARIGYLVHNTPQDFTILAGSAGFLLGALAMGAVGCIAALANIASEPLAQMLECVQSGDWGQAKAIQLRLIAANEAVTKRFGVAGLKAAMDMMGLYGGPVRGPLLQISIEEKANLRAILMSAGLVE